MDHLELDSSSCKPCSPDSEPDHEALPAAVSHKRKAGRKKFKETRHPVFRGVRQRKGNKWVCEVREPYKKSRIWLGTYPSPEMAARAYDVAALALRGKSATLNFPDSSSILPLAKSSSARDIQTAALAAAEAFRTTTTACCSLSSLALDNMISSHSTSSTNIIDQPGCSSSPIPNEKKLCLVEIQPDENDHCSILGHSERLETKANESNDPLFIDEEASFNMPGLLHSMAEGMLLSPPALQGEVDWDDDTTSNINIDLWGAH
ncbi:dehydration-responsive element-binding protein 1F-like [Durio zibethinus]|uniref:Dehydration-responsive element-binding protein 1F-like n=1 Tax=Durio zibethinus TaxID=66656 RepID=A0A6P5XQ33_DURZI|nr:dehydration-responsive element-binding protein 1F-like [Durio zibethinus]